MVKLQDFIASNPDLEIPFRPDERTKYPDGVWQELLQSVVATLLQTTNKNDAIEQFKAQVMAGDELGGLTLDNVLTWWIRAQFESAERIVGGSLMNDKIEDDFDELVEVEEITCTDWHSAEEKRRADAGEELEEHTHTLRHVKVNDDNREDFENLVKRIMQKSFPEDFGELPEEYKEAEMPDFASLLKSLGGAGGGMPPGMAEMLGGAGADEVDEEDITDVDADVIGSVDLDAEDEDGKHPLA